MKYITQIDDSVGLGATTIADMQTSGATYGVGISTNLVVGIITASSIKIGGGGGGLEIPRLTTVQRNALGSVTVGTLIFNDTSGKLNVYGAGGWEAITTTPA